MNMHQIVVSLLTREKERINAFRFDVKKALDLLGNVYAPLFFCAACLLGLSVPVLAWKSGGVINALLGARGVGTLTSELTQGMWVMIITGAVLLASELILYRLEGKMREVFLSIARIGEIVALLLLSIGTLSLFFSNIVLLFLWNIFESTRIRTGIACIWFLGLSWIFFSLVTDVTLRVSTLGNAMSILLINIFFFGAVTRTFFIKR